MILDPFPLYIIMGRGVEVTVAIIQDLVLSEPVRTLTEEEVDQLQLQYYNTDVHRAAFTLPQFVKKVCMITIIIIASYISPDSPTVR